MSVLRHAAARWLSLHHEELVAWRRHIHAHPELGRQEFATTQFVASHLANVGDAKSLVIHPATTTHYRMSDEDLKKAGITAGTVRLSIGLEDPQDLIDDLERALRASNKA